MTIIIHVESLPSPMPPGRGRRKFEIVDPTGLDVEAFIRKRTTRTHAAVRPLYFEPVDDVSDACGPYWALEWQEWDG